MSLNFCDLLVLGSDLSGVIAATLLAKRGMNVLLLDDEEETERNPNLATGLETRAFKSLLSKLMISESRIQVLQENKIACQMILPRHRIDLPPSHDLLLKEIAREFPGEREIFQEFLQEVEALREKILDPLLGFLPLIGRKETRLFHKWVKEIPDEKVIALWEKFSPEFQGFCRIFLRFLSRGPLMEPLTLQLVLYFSPENATTFTIRGGARELKSLFFERLDYFGGLIHPMAGDEFEILAKGREIRGVKLNRYSHPTRCRYLLGNLNLQSFYHHLPQNLWSFWVKRKIREVPATEAEHLVQFEVEREALPGPMKENLAIVQDPTAPLTGLNYLELNVTPVGKGEQALLSVSYRYPPSGNPPLYEEIHREIEGRLKRLIPFSSPRMVFPLPGEEGSLFPETGEFPLFMKRALKKRVYPSTLFPRPVTTPFKNGFLLGPNILEPLGMEGKLLSALKGVELIWEREARLKKT